MGIFLGTRVGKSVEMDDQACSLILKWGVPFISGWTQSNAPSLPPAPQEILDILRLIPLLFGTLFYYGKAMQLYNEKQRINSCRAIGYADAGQLCTMEVGGMYHFRLQLLISSLTVSALGVPWPSDVSTCYKYSGPNSGLLPNKGPPFMSRPNFH